MGKDSDENIEVRYGSHGFSGHLEIRKDHDPNQTAKNCYYN